MKVWNFLFCSVSVLETQCRCSVTLAKEAEASHSEAVLGQNTDTLSTTPEDCAWPYGKQNLQLLGQPTQDIGRPCSKVKQPKAAFHCGAYYPRTLSPLQVHSACPGFYRKLQSELRIVLLFHDIAWVMFIVMSILKAQESAWMQSIYNTQERQHEEFLLTKT